MSNPATILFKFASRGRRERFFSSLDSIYNNIADTDNFLVSVSLDRDDDIMNDREVIEKILSYSNIEIAWGVSDSKVHAINRDIPDYGNIIIAMQDDLLFNCYAFDEYIRQAFKENFPDFDGLCHYPDGDVKQELATIYIAGRKFYNRIGNIYPKQYRSLWCDNHVFEMAKLIGKHKYIDFPMFKHLCAAYGHLTRDEMFDRQQLDWDEDFKIFQYQKSINFGL